MCVWGGGGGGGGFILNEILLEGDSNESFAISNRFQLNTCALNAEMNKKVTFSRDTILLPFCDVGPGRSVNLELEAAIS